MNIHDFANTVETKHDFDKFLLMLHEEYTTKGRTWENNTLDYYLEALSSYSVDIDDYYKNIQETVDVNIPTWRLFAHIMLGATIYE